MKDDPIKRDTLTDWRENKRILTERLLEKEKHLTEEKKQLTILLEKEKNRMLLEREQHHGKKKTKLC